MSHSCHSPYNIDIWSEGYFAVAQNNQLIVQAHGADGPSASLSAIVQQAQNNNLQCPLLIRFSDILSDRVQRLQAAFNQALQQQQLSTSYTAIYPIKVNQQKRVIDCLQQAGGQQFGLEVGSKPELLAALSIAPSGSTIICNGYKDQEYIRLALLAHKLGHRAYLVIEKSSETAMIVQQAQALQVTPLLGVRVRLASIANGNWQNSGGEKAKFGLTAAQLLKTCDYLKQNQLDLNLLHIHMGSQIANIHDIQQGLQEIVRYYAELRELGFSITHVDVGGGLAIDYEGSGARHDFSMNYQMQEYANTIVRVLHDYCHEKQLPMPHLLSESGRALTAHHAVLITNITDIEPYQLQQDLPEQDTLSPALQALKHLATQDSNHTLIENYHNLVHQYQTCQHQFLNGVISLSELSLAETYYRHTCLKIKQNLQPEHRQQLNLRDELEELCADKLFVNFSIFQSLPDIWALEQIFPIMPLVYGQQDAQQHTVIQDLTCDSDGRIDHYVDETGIRHTLTLPQQETDTLLGFFLVGAYQETLGDEHNLFGKPHVIDVTIHGQDDFSITHIEPGDKVTDLLIPLGFEKDDLLKSFQDKMAQSNINMDERTHLLQELCDALAGYTYLED